MVVVEGHPNRIGYCIIQRKVLAGRCENNVRARDVANRPRGL